MLKPRKLFSIAKIGSTIELLGRWFELFGQNSTNETEFSISDLEKKKKSMEKPSRCFFWHRIWVNQN